MAHSQWEPGPALAPPTSGLHFAAAAAGRVGALHAAPGTGSDMVSLLCCGPKLAACGIVLSAWGVIMLVGHRRGEQGWRCLAGGPCRPRDLAAAAVGGDREVPSCEEEGVGGDTGHAGLGHGSGAQPWKVFPPLVGAGTRSRPVPVVCKQARGLTAAGAS